MRHSKTLSMLVLALAVTGELAHPAAAQTFINPRQYYSSWSKHPVHSYHYRRYYYKPTAAYSGYRHHYVVFLPARPQYLYFYNPYTRLYWGRCPAQRDGSAVYSMLAEKDRKETLAEIKESAFPKPGKVPAIPESTDNLPLDLPPDDLPEAASGVASGPSVGPPRTAE